MNIRTLAQSVRIADAPVSVTLILHQDHAISRHPLASPTPAELLASARQRRNGADP